MTTFTNTKETKTLQTIEVTEQRDMGATTLAHRVTQPTIHSAGPAPDTPHAAPSERHITHSVYNILAQHTVDVEISPLTCSCAPYVTTHIAFEKTRWWPLLAETCSFFFCYLIIRLLGIHSCVFDCLITLPIHLVIMNLYHWCKQQSHKCFPNGTFFRWVVLRKDAFEIQRSALNICEKTFL